MATLDFNASEYVVQDYAPIEPGEYNAIIIESDDKPTAKGGRYVALKLQIVDGKYQNRTLYDNLNLWNRSEQAQNIARGTLAAICKAVGVANPPNTAVLHNKRLRVVVALEKREDTGEFKNVVKAYRPCDNMVAAAPVVAHTGVAKPW